MDIQKKQVYFIVFLVFYFIVIYISGGRSPFFNDFTHSIYGVVEKNFRKIILKCYPILTIFIICETYFNLERQVFIKFLL